MYPESIPDRDSNAGPESKADEYNWRDRIDFARDFAIKASRTESDKGNMQRRCWIAAAIAELELAEEELSK